MGPTNNSDAFDRIGPTVLVQGLLEEGPPVAEFGHARLEAVVVVVHLLFRAWYGIRIGSNRIKRFPNLKKNPLL